MAYSLEKSTGDIIISGWEQGIASSPHKGLANIQNANIVTENGEVMCNFTRVNQTPFYTIATGGIHANSTNRLTWTATQTPFIGQAIQVTASTITNFTPTTGQGGQPYFFIVSVTGSVGNYTIAVSWTYGGVVIANLGVTGVATVSNEIQNSTSVIFAPVAGCYEQYFNGVSEQYRYYILDSLGYVWVQDTAINPGFWGLIDIAQSPTASGIAILNGYLHLFTQTSILYKETCGTLSGNVYASMLGITWAVMTSTNSRTNFPFVLNTSLEGNPNPHFTLVGHQATLNYTDGAYIGTIIPFSTSSALNANVFSYGSYTGPSSNAITVSSMFAGTFPVIGETITFSTAPGSTMDTAISSGTVYYVIASGYNPTAGSFEICATVGGSTVSWNGNGSGTQYFNSYNPNNGNVGGAITSGGTITGGAAVQGSGGYTYLATPQACTCPQFEITTALAELGNTLIIGCQGNTLYQWDEVSLSPTNFVPLSENYCAYLLTVNNVVYVFQGYKGNIYVTTGSAASAALTVPDYLAGIPGTSSTYIEPVFNFGQAFQTRGRIFFSIQDQTATKTGNCGGIYSFIPSFFNTVTGQDSGTALRCENQNSYNTSNGLATVLIPNQQQNIVGVQYFSGWTSSISSPLYGIDSSGATPTPTATIETDIIPVGTYFDKTSFSQFEYKLSAPLAVRESVQLKWRTDMTSSWSSALTNQGETTTVDGSGTIVSGYFESNFQNAQWLQFQIVLTSTTTNPSFVRLLEIRIISPKE